jgi:hypothetical protein
MESNMTYRVPEMSTDIARPLWPKVSAGLESGVPEIARSGRRAEWFVVDKESSGR